MLCQKKKLSVLAAVIVLFMLTSLSLYFFSHITFEGNSNNTDRPFDVFYITQAVSMCTPVDTENTGRYITTEIISAGAAEKGQRADACFGFNLSYPADSLYFVSMPAVLSGTSGNTVAFDGIVMLC